MNKNKYREIDRLELSVQLRREYDFYERKKFMLAISFVIL